MKKIYLDNSATTPVDKDVFKAMSPFYNKRFHNAGSMHSDGLLAKKELEKSRAFIAKNICARQEEIIFTAGATESDNIAILGLVSNWREDNPNKIPHIITSNIEHQAVLETCKYLAEKKLAEVSFIEVDKNGIVNAGDLKKTLRENTILVSVMYVNNEIGTIQPIREIAKVIRLWRKQNNTQFPYFHSDAVQAVNYLEIDVLKLGVDMMTINASKIYGPKMVGVLYKKTSFSISPILRGGKQEFGLRPGTENIAGCVGMAKSLEITSKLRESESKRLSEIQKYFISELEKIEGVGINGSIENRIPNNVNIFVKDISGEELLLRLDGRGIACSTQSACKDDNSQHSYVIKALGLDLDEERDAIIRFSMGRDTSKKNISQVIKSLRDILYKYRKI